MDILKNYRTLKLNSHKRFHVCIGILSVIITTGVCLLTVSAVYIANGFLKGKGDISTSLSTKQSGPDNDSEVSKSDIEKSRDQLLKPEKQRHFNLTNQTEAITRKPRESDAPTNVRMEVKSSTSVHVTWKPPPLHTLRAMFRGYHLFFQEIDARGEVVEPEQIYLNDKSVTDCEFKVNHLKPNTSYAIEVGVWYGRHGNGEMSTKIYAKTSVVTTCRQLIYGNVALNKRAYMDSVWEARGLRLEAKNAVDGLLGSTKLNSQSIAHTNYSKHPWLTVDLGHIYEVHHVIMFNRRDDHGRYLHDVEIRIGNSSVWDNMVICGTFEGPGRTSSIYKIMCREPLEGQFVTFKIVKDNPSVVPSQRNALGVSEVYIMVPGYVPYLC